jgi:hypothetical protein
MLQRLRDTNPRYSIELWGEDRAAVVALVEAAQRHVEDCCRTDIGWREQMRSHDALVDAVAVFTEGRSGEDVDEQR